MGQSMAHADSGTLMALLDGEIAVPERAALEAHLEACTECGEELAELRTLARAFTASLAVGSGTIPLLAARARFEDHSPRPRLQRPVTMLPVSGASGLLKAAAVVLLMAGGASAAIPDSPVRRAAAAVAEFVGRLVADEPPATVEPTAPVDVVVQEPAGPLPGVGLTPIDGHVRVSLHNVDPGARIVVRLIDQRSGSVRAPRAGAGQAEPTFGYGSGGNNHVDVTGITAGIIVELPRSVDSAIVEVDGAAYFVKSGANQRILGPNSERRDDEVIFRARS
jgi:hypothetical protein